MDAYKKWFDGIQRDDEVPEVVKNAVGETLQYLPEVPQKMHKKNVWKRVAVAATVLVIIGGGVLAVNPSLAANLPVIGSIFQQVGKEAVYSGEYKNSEQIKPEGNKLFKRGKSRN